MALIYDPDQPLDNQNTSSPYNPNLLQQIESVQPKQDSLPKLAPTETEFKPTPVEVSKPSKDYVPKEATVGGQLENVISRTNPLLQQAEARGMQKAQKRGLLNTSMGVEAGESAFYDKALQIAAPDAQTYKEAAAREQTTEYQGSLNEQQAKLQQQNTLQQAIATGDINKQQAVIKSIQDTQQAKISALIDREKLDASLRQTLMQDIGTAGSALTTSIEYILRDPDLDAQAKTDGIQLMTERYEANVDTAAALAGVELVWT